MSSGDARKPYTTIGYNVLIAKPRGRFKVNLIMMLLFKDTVLNYAYVIPCQVSTYLKLCFQFKLVLICKIMCANLYVNYVLAISTKIFFRWILKRTRLLDKSFRPSNPAECVNRTAVHHTCV